LIFATPQVETRIDLETSHRLKLLDEARRLNLWTRFELSNTGVPFCIECSVQCTGKGRVLLRWTLQRHPLCPCIRNGDTGQAPRAQSQVLGLAIAGRRGYASVRDLFRLPLDKFLCQLADIKTYP